MYRVFALLIVGICIVTRALAQLTVASIFQSHMVLQHDTWMTLSGTCAPGATVQVWTNWRQKGSVTATGTRWSLRIRTPSMGSQYKMQVKSGAQRISYTDILSGIVFVASGQSNMEMPLDKPNSGFPAVIGGPEAAAAANASNMRLLRVSPQASSSRMSSFNGQWEDTNVFSAGGFSAVGFFFADKIFKETGIPLGIIQIAAGGTKLEQWLDPNELAGLWNMPEELQTPLGQSYGEYFNGMVAPITGFPISAFIFYQGEGNTYNPEYYAQRFERLIESWRGNWGARAPIPFYYVQIAPYSNYVNSGSPAVRDAQTQSLNVPSTGMACTLDLVEDTTCSACVHPSRKQEVGDRLAKWALHDLFGMTSQVLSGPVYRSYSTDTGVVTLRFSYTDGGLFLTAPGGSPSGFTIVDPLNNVYSANAVVVDDTVKVWHPNVAFPVAVRYAWSNGAVSTFENGAGLPAPTFRTDR